jgi:uncharacterized protein (TIGR00251 family)
MTSKNETRITVRVHPSAHKNEILDFADGVLRVKVAAPPVRDKANKELIAFLSQVLDVNKNNLSILKGYTSRNKIIAIEGLSREEVMKRLSH